MFPNFPSYFSDLKLKWKEPAKRKFDPDIFEKNVECKKQNSEWNKNWYTDTDFVPSNDISTSSTTEANTFDFGNPTPTITTLDLWNKL